MCCFLTFLAWNGMSSLETSLLRVPCLLKWKENSHYSKCPVNFPGVSPASTSNLQSSNWQFSTHPMEMQRSIHSTTGNSQRKGSLGSRRARRAQSVVRWRSWWASYKYSDVYSAAFQHEPSSKAVLRSSKPLSIDIRIFPNMIKYANEHRIYLTLIHERHGECQARQG